MSMPAKRTVDRVVVAVDGSPASVRALVWALGHAADAGHTVEVLTTWPLRGPVFVREVSGHFCEPRWAAREAQAAAAAEALAAVEVAPAYELTVENALLVDALVRAAARAALVVVGSDGVADGPRDRRRLSERVRQAVPGPVVVLGRDAVVGHAADLIRSAAPTM
jgi:hypothetical protein